MKVETKLKSFVKESIKEAVENMVDDYSDGPSNYWGGPDVNHMTKTETAIGRVIFENGVKGTLSLKIKFDKE